MQFYGIEILNAPEANISSTVLGYLSDIFRNISAILMLKNIGKISSFYKFVVTLITIEFYYNRLRIYTEFNLLDNYFPNFSSVYSCKRLCTCDKIFFNFSSSKYILMICFTYSFLHEFFYAIFV